MKTIIKYFKDSNVEEAWACSVVFEKRTRTERDSYLSTLKQNQSAQVKRHHFLSSYFLVQCHIRGFPLQRREGMGGDYKGVIDTRS